MNIMRIVVLISFIQIMLYAEGPIKTDTKQKIEFAVQGFSNENYHSIGFLNAVRSSSYDLFCGNPAAISDFKTISIGGSYQFGTEIDDIASGIGYRRLYPLVPKSIGVVYPYNNLYFGFGCHQKYSLNVDFEGAIPSSYEDVYDADHPIPPESETLIYGASGIFAYELNNIFNTNQAISFGLQLGVDYLRDVFFISNTEFTREDWSLSWNIGLRYYISDQFIFGVIYDRGNEFSGKEEIQYRYPATLEDNNDELEAGNKSFIAKLPDKLTFGVEYKINDQLSLSGTMATTFWNNIEDTWKNQTDISGSVIFPLSDIVKTSVGIIRINQKSKLFYDSIIEYYVTYLNAGIAIELSHLNVYFLLSDSHFFTWDTGKQTKFSLGCEFSL